MTTNIVMDELHIQILASRALANPELTTLRRFLASQVFRRRVVRAVKSLLGGNPGMPITRVRLVR